MINPDRYLEPSEDAGIICTTHEPLCEQCETVPDEVTHHIESETLIWQCPTCGHYNTESNVPADACLEPDPDEASEWNFAN